MKRNITVNLCGSLYHIDEDAYELLNKYLGDMRAIFSKQPGGEEVADDIESRVAELMNDKRVEGADVITIDDVQAIIQRIGTPDEMRDAENDETTRRPLQTPPPFPGESTKASGKKKLYRDINNKMLGGVLAGLGQFFGIDPLWLRLATVILTFVLQGLTIPAYILLWILVPAATTPAERLEMKGEAVNMENLSDQIVNESKGNYAAATGNKILNYIFNVICVLFKAIVIMFGFCTALTLAGLFLFATVIIGWITIAPEAFVSIALELDSNILNLRSLLPLFPTWCFYIFGSIMLLLTIYFIVYAMLALAGRKLSLSGIKLKTAIISWSASFILTAAFGGVLIGNITRNKLTVEAALEQRRIEYRDTRKEKSKDYLNHNGWRVARERNVKSFSDLGDDVNGNHDRRYLHGSNRSGDMEYEVVRDVKVAPGQYTLTAYGRADGNGAEIFAADSHGKRYASAIPAYGDKGGDLWNEAMKYIEADTVKTSADYKKMERIATAHNHRGYGWSQIKIENIIVGPDSVLTYGVTNCSPATPWTGTWLSADSFALKKTN